ncbi:hypothetical protein Hanom_Chr11g01036051 [Helianthus anomalus]
MVGLSRSHPHAKIGPATNGLIMSKNISLVVIFIFRVDAEVGLFPKEDPSCIFF